MKTIRLAANAMVCVVNQAACLLKRQLESQGQTFVERGGFTETLYSARMQFSQSDPSYKSYKSYKSDKPPAPPCPKCGHPMVRRIVRKRLNATQPF
jgi:restriction system protein